MINVKELKSIVRQLKRDWLSHISGHKLKSLFPKGWDLNWEVHCYEKQDTVLLELTTLVDGDIPIDELFKIEEEDRIWLKKYFKTDIIRAEHNRHEDRTYTHYVIFL